MSRFRLYPSVSQERLLLEHCAHARYVWNLGLEQRLMWRRWQGPTPGFSEQCRQLTEARAAESWLAGGPQIIQQQALRDLDQAWRNFFAGTHARPTWRKQGQHEGFRVVNGHGIKVRQDSARWSSVLIPKVGWVRFRRSRVLPDARSYRVTRDRSGRWHIAFAAIPAAIAPQGTGEIVGIDRGVAVAVTLSTGEVSSPARLRPKEAERLLRLQRRLSRAQKGSNRRAVIKRRAARIKARETDRRRDWIEKASTDLARRFDVIRIEDLRVANLTRSGRGSVGALGKNVQAKASLNGAILSQGWGRLVLRLEQKAPGRVEKVNPAYTSQTCNACKHCAPENRKSQAVFQCVACGHRANADVNAARNIRDREPAAGRAVAARGDLVHQGRSVKREPQPACRSAA